MTTISNIGDQLRFGLREAIPADATAAWGARLIVEQGGHVDFVWDRQDAAGPDEQRRALLTRLNEQFGPDQLSAKLRELLRSGRMNTRQAERITVYSSPLLEVAVDTHGSAGYCYVAAWSPNPEGE